MSSAAAIPQESSPVNKPSIWLWNPFVDLMIGCGAWSAPLVLLVYPLQTSSVETLSIFFYAFALVCNYPHFMATIYRAYHTREDFEKYRIFTVHITGLMLLAGLLSHLNFALLPWLFTIYITWSPWHYSGQNYGLLMMFVRRNGINPSTQERNLLWSAFLCSYL